MRNKIISGLVFLIILYGISAFSFINFGVGYSFGSEKSNWILRIGHESDNFVVNADYFINAGWNTNGAFFFSTRTPILIGPMINIFNEFGASVLKLVYGPAIALDYSQIGLRIGMLSDFSKGFALINFSENLYAQLRYYVPDPPGMKMKDKLYIEFRYLLSHVTILVGLLEP